jgi:dTDP-4-dehydrorhamnose 3,5-epimerase-like enzyme
MIFVETELAGVWRIAIEPRRDERGYFARAFCRREWLRRRGVGRNVGSKQACGKIGK